MSENDELKTVKVPLRAHKILKYLDYDNGGKTYGQLIEHALIKTYGDKLPWNLK